MKRKRTTGKGKRAKARSSTPALPPQPQESPQEKLKSIREELKTCVGPQNILRAKMLRRQRQRLERLLSQTAAGELTVEQKQWRQQIKRLEKSLNVKVDPKRLQKRMSTEYRLLPPPNRNQRNVFHSMSDARQKKWQTLRAYKKRYEFAFGAKMPGAHHTGTQGNSIDTCVRCGVDRVVDKEHNTMTCPKCGVTKRFAAHIFENIDKEREDRKSSRGNLNHLQKFSAQFEKGYPAAKTHVLEAFAAEYSRAFHFRDPNKVKSCYTESIIKKLKNLPRVYKRAKDRITKELKADSIPEYTPSEIARLLNQRVRLRGPQESRSGGPANKKQKKSLGCQTLMRHMGRAEGMPQSRLFPQAKTVDIHVARLHDLEAIMKQAKKQQVVTNRSAANVSWHMYPAT